MTNRIAALSAACVHHAMHPKVAYLAGDLKHKDIGVVVPPMTAVVRGLQIMSSMAARLYGMSFLECDILPLIFCVPPNAKIPVKLASNCTCFSAAGKSWKFSFLFGPEVQKIILGFAPNPKVSGGCGVKYKDKKYILMPDPFALDVTQDWTEEDDPGLEKDVLEIYLKSVETSARFVKEWM